MDGWWAIGSDVSFPPSFHSAFVRRNNLRRELHLKSPKQSEAKSPQLPCFMWLVSGLLASDSCSHSISSRRRPRLLSLTDF